MPATLPAASGPAEAADPVSAAVAGLAQLADRPLDEHPEAYQQVHATLQQALQDIPT
ncbi:MAG: hypothetical protein ACTHMS_06270 [Jatrophihabitans sp.]|uniref:hypothetical protein n=1 Tax=Jatrophihabitans sp. TaxID=1932789 RepID=UPI003F7D333B